MPGDRILVNKIGGASSLQQGDLVVLDGTRTFADRAPGPGSGSSSVLTAVMGSMASTSSIRLSESDYVRRVVGLPGDHVAFCDASGRLSVDDVAIDSADSRVHLGDPGGGMVRLDVVIGRVAMICSPPAQLGILHAPASLEGIRASALGRRP